MRKWHQLQIHKQNSPQAPTKSSSEPYCTIVAPQGNREYVLVNPTASLWEPTFVHVFIFFIPQRVAQEQQNSQLHTPVCVALPSIF